MPLPKKPDTGLPFGGRDAASSEADVIRRPALVFIDPETFSRECVTHCLRASLADMDVVAFAGAAEAAYANLVPEAASIVLLHIHQGRVGDADLDQNLTILKGLFPEARSVLLADGEGVDQILAALARDARGYILTSVTLEVAVEAIRLVRAGGTFIPASTLAASASLSIGAKANGRADFTPRQYAVLQQLRKGRSNKTIAHELGTSESAVKAHVRIIMKKLGATNRTEVIYLTLGAHWLGREES